MIRKEQQVCEHSQAERGNGQTVVLAINGVEQTTTKAAVCQSLGVESIIRIRQAEYPDVAQAGDVVTHFGLYISQTTDLVGQRTVLARIVKGGYHDAKRNVERLPILQFDYCWVGEIVTSIPEISCMDISATFFAGPTVGAIASLGDLQHVILQRYTESTRMTTEEILAQKFSVRQVGLLGRVAEF